MPGARGVRMLGLCVIASSWYPSHLAFSITLSIPTARLHTASCPKAFLTAFPTTSSRDGSSMDAQLL